MQWSDIAPLVADAAPTLGKMLGGAVGGPLGAAIGGTAGDILAGALGVKATPEAVGDALIAPDQSRVVAAVQAAETEAVARWQALSEMVKADADLGKTQVHEIAETMQTELSLGALATGKVRDSILFLQASWRPVAMYVWVATWPWQLWFAFYQTGGVATARDAALSALAWWNTTPALLAGAYSIGRSLEKVKDVQANVAGGAATVAGKVLSVVKGRR